MLEDFMPREDKTSPVRSGEVFKPSTGQEKPAPIEQKPAAPAGPYRPTILNQTTVAQQPPQQPPQTTVSADDQLPQKPEGEKPQQMTKNPKSMIKKVITVLIIIAIMGGGGFAGWWYGLRDTGISSSTKNNTVVVTEKTEANTPKLAPAPLSGVDVDPSLASRAVTAIMIENSEEARPQSGLNDADVVFEAIAEGGITRFLALFQSKKPDYIGPVRSARPYYAEWAKTFDASYVHAGGSPDGLQTIAGLGVKDISAFAYGDDVFYRTTDRQSPHNLYSSFKGLDRVNQEKGFTGSKFTAWNRKKDVPQTPIASKIDITISTPYYNPSYTYDVTSNSYLRSEGGEVHKDEKSGKQLSPKTVLVMVMNRSQNGIYSVYKTNGSGKFIAFQDGVATDGNWSRTNVTDQYAFKDANGFEYLFNKGQVWTSIVTDTANVKYVP